MNDELWQIEHQSRRLRGFREELTPFWDDDAARDLNLRLLNPHQDDDESMVQALTEQAALLSEIEKKLFQVTALITTITTLSKQVDTLVATSQQEFENGYQLYDLYMNYYGETRELLPKIEMFIRSANQACHGVAAS